MDLTVWVTDKPRLMTVCVEPVNFETGAVFLAAPTAAALHIENIHVEFGGGVPLATSYAAAARFSRM